MLSLEKIDRLNQEQILMSLKNSNNLIVNFYFDRDFLLEYTSKLLQLLNPEEKNGLFFGSKHKKRRWRSKRVTGLKDILQNYMMNVALSLERRYSNCAPLELKLEVYNIIQHIRVSKAKRSRKHRRSNKQVC